jgi:hypothetical protein
MMVNNRDQVHRADHEESFGRSHEDWYFLL